MGLRSAVDFELSEREAGITRTILVPLMGAVCATVLGVAIARACCGFQVKKVDPYGIVPIGMTVLTSGIAVWSYLNPPPGDMPSRTRRAVKARQNP